MKAEEIHKESEVYLSCNLDEKSGNLEDSFRKDFDDLNSNQANITDRNEGNLENNKPKSSDKIYDVQKIILMIRVFNLSLHVLKFRDNKIKSNENVKFSLFFQFLHFFISANFQFLRFLNFCVFSIFAFFQFLRFFNFFTFFHFLCFFSFFSFFVFFLNFRTFSIFSLFPHFLDNSPIGFNR